MNKQLTFLLSLTFLFLFSGSSVVFGDSIDDAYKRKDYKTAYKLWLPLAEQGYADAQCYLEGMYFDGLGDTLDHALAHMWLNNAGSNGDKDAVKNGIILEKEMTPEEIE